MKNIVLVAMMLLSVMACKQNEPEIKTVGIENQQTELVENPYKDYAKAEFEIKGMTCAMGCAKAIEKKISKLEGVHFVHVNFEKELAMVEFDDSKISNEDFFKTVAKVSDTYKVGEINTVEIFTKDLKEKESVPNKCKKDCKKACCSASKNDSKTACVKDCKKACCAKPGKV